MSYIEYSQGTSSPDLAHEVFCEAKEGRRRAEQDAQILANRIALLKAEESKAWKKIEETKKKAKDIMQTRQRNQEAQMTKQRAIKEREDEENARKQQLRKSKSQNEILRSRAIQQHQRKIKESSKAVKQTKMENRDALAAQRIQTRANNRNVKAQIQQGKNRAQQLRQQMAEEKRARARIDLYRRAENEANIRQGHEREVTAMELDELDLIARLQNTQSVQRNAYEDLENALNGGLAYNY